MCFKHKLSDLLLGQQGASWAHHHSEGSDLDSDCVLVFSFLFFFFLSCLPTNDSKPKLRKKLNMFAKVYFPTFDF